MKTRKLKIAVKLLIPILIINICICVSLGVVINQRAASSLIEMGREEALLVAKEVARGIDGDMLAGLAPGMEGSEEYSQLMEMINDKISDTRILYVYSLYLEDDVIRYGLDSNRDEQIGDPYDDDYDEVLEAFGGQITVSDAIDVTDDGELLTALLPVYDSSDRVVAVIGADYDASNVAGRIRGNKQAVVLFVGIAALAMAGVITFLVSRVIRNLKLVNRKLYELVNNEGDLTQTIDIRSGDEIELIADNVNRMLAYIGEIMKKISENSTTLNKSSQRMVEHLTTAGDHVTDVSATMEEMSAAMEETSASIMQVNTSMEEIFQYVEGMSGNARKESEASESIRAKAEAIRKDAVLAKDKASDETKTMEQRIREKIEKSREVEQISNLTADIISITSQTNLLSLNASIEAARAGEMGRGFAVVADEIGKLANDSGQAAAQIQKVSAVVIEAVTELAGEAANMVELTDRIMKEGFDRLEETGGMYSSDIAGMNQTIRYFAETAENLKKNMEGIRYAVNDVSVAAEESAKGITNVMEMSVELTNNVNGLGEEAKLSEEIVKELNREVDRFKL